MGQAGLQPSGISTNQIKDLQRPVTPRAAKSDAIPSEIATGDENLKRIAAAWGSLPLEARSAILAIVNAELGRA